MSSYTTMDCLLLYCIGTSRKGSSLREILSSADYLNRSDISYDEINQGLSRLVSNGFVSIDDYRRCHQTEKAIHYISTHKKWGRGIIEEWIDVSRQLVDLPFETMPNNQVYFLEHEYIEANERSNTTNTRMAFLIVAGIIGLVFLFIVGVAALVNAFIK